MKISSLRCSGHSKRQIKIRQDATTEINRKIYVNEGVSKEIQTPQF